VYEEESVSRHGRLAGKVLTTCIVGLALLGLVFPALAQNELIRIDTDSQIPIDIRADKVEYDDTSGNYVAAGEVELIRGELRLFADRVELNGQNMIALAEGKVRLSTPEQIITADRMVVDVNQGTGKVYNGLIYLRSNSYYLRGAEMEKTGKYTYRVFDGGFTTCDGSNPPWEVTASEMEVRLEGYGVAKNTAFRAKDIPVLWTPYLVFPVKTKRESGFLIPYMGSTTRDGFVASLPWFQVINDDMDATFTVTYMGKRGFDMGAEFRYKRDDYSQGMVMLDYLPDDDAAPELYEKGELAEAYDARWWFRAKANQRLFNKKVNVKVDIDVVSDQDYLREFVEGTHRLRAQQPGL
jgi:LPS-assembly protein